MIIIGGLSVMSILGCEKQEEKNNRKWSGHYEKNENIFTALFNVSYQYEFGGK